MSGTVPPELIPVDDAPLPVYSPLPGGVVVRNLAGLRLTPQLPPGWFPIWDPYAPAIGPQTLRERFEAGAAARARAALLAPRGPRAGRVA
jgi:hypothetical protein